MAEPLTDCVKRALTTAGPPVTGRDATNAFGAEWPVAWIPTLPQVGQLAAGVLRGTSVPSRKPTPPSDSSKSTQNIGVGHWDAHHPSEPASRQFFASASDAASPTSAPASRGIRARSGATSRAASLEDG